MMFPVFAAALLFSTWGPLPSKWVIATGTSYPNGPGNWGTNEVQTYTKSPSNINITSSGTLLITPLRVSVALPSVDDYWTSARIETITDHIACPPGGKLLMSASLRFGSAPSPSQMGIWPSFWALGSEFRRSGKFDQWPGAGEIDIAESTNGSPAVWQSLHCGVAPGGPCNEFSGLSTSTPLESLRDGRTFHVFGAEIDRTNPGGDWKGEKLTYLVDGRPMVVLTGAQIGDEKAWTAVTRMPKYLILNVAVGGDFPNNVANLEGGKTPNGKTAGGIEAGLEVEWVAAYST